MDIIFVNEQHFWQRTNFFVMMVCSKKGTNDIDRSEKWKKNGRFKIIQKDFNKNDRYFLNEQLFSKTLVFFTNFWRKKNYCCFYWTNNIIEQTILLNERFYWMNDFAERLFTEKTNEIDGKLAIFLRTKKYFFFELL